MQPCKIVGVIFLSFLFVSSVSLAKANDLNSELLQAAEAGDILRVLEALDQGANIEATNEAGATPLMWAAVNGHVAVVQLLIKRGANVNARTASEATALKGAAMQGHLDVVQALLRAGADVNAKDNQGQTALDVARDAGQNAVVVLLSNAKGADSSKEQQALSAARDWLAIVDEGKYSQSWDQSAPRFKSIINKSKWKSSLDSVRKPLGIVNSRTLKTTKYTRSLPEAPVGEYLVLTFDTDFKNKGHMTETVTPMLDEEGKWRVSGYYIR